jgi:pentatricopeptide repeat protein
MRSCGLAPNVITYNSVINACAKGGEWQCALGLLEEMRSRGLVPTRSRTAASSTLVPSVASRPSDKS